MILRQARDDLVQMHVREAHIGVHQQIASRSEPLQHVHRFEQRRVLNNQRVRLLNGLAQADFLVADATEGDHGSAGALRAEAWKGLGVFAFEKRRDRKQFSGGDRALAAATVDSNLKHRRLPVPADYSVFYEKGLLDL